MGGVRKGKEGIKRKVLFRMGEIWRGQKLENQYFK